MVQNMKNAFFVLLAVIVLVAVMPTPSHAGAQEYRFEIVDQTIHAGGKVPIRVRLVQIATGKTISNADIAEPKLVMRMAGMADMQGEAVKMTPDAEGNYRFAANVVAPGEWVLNLTAHVQGEKDAVQGSLTFQVVK
jgi:hypothetical protein